MNSEEKKIDARPPHYRIIQGEYFASNSEVVISTILGSCVAVCLYDPFQRVVGMNHIMTSREEFAESKAVCYPEDGKYGFCAMDLLIREMIGKGALLKNMIAKVFGGASLLKPYKECFIEYCVGVENVQFVTEYLKINSIPVVKKSVGGDHGRAIRFYSGDYSVWVKKVKKRSNPTLIQKDDKAWGRLRA